MRQFVPCHLLILLFLPACRVPRLPEQSFSREQLTRYYADEAGVAAVPVGRVRLHDGGPAIKKAFLEAVRDARDHVLVDSFLLNDGPEVRPVLDSLARKEQQGVKVRLIGDASSRFVPEAAAFDYLEQVRVPHAEFHPFEPKNVFQLRRVLERDHRKFWVIDGRRILVGGANLNDLSLRAPESGGNLDFMVDIESPRAAAELTRSFVETWNQSETDGTLDEADFETLGRTPEEGGRVWLFNQSPRSEEASLTGVMMNGLFGSARKSVWLVQPYTFVNAEILGPVRELARRGVEVNVVLSERTKAPRFRRAAYFGISDLLVAGAKVWVFKCGEAALHYKCVLVDDDLAYVGSANLNWRSYHLARELGVVFDDPSAVASVRGMLDRVLANCRRVSRQEALLYRHPGNLTYWMLMQTGG